MAAELILWDNSQKTGYVGLKQLCLAALNHRAVNREFGLGDHNQQTVSVDSPPSATTARKDRVEDGVQSKKKKKPA